MLTIARELDEGYSEREIARKFEQPVSWVSERLDWLRSEVALQQGFLPLSDEEYEDLKFSIEQYGVKAPIVISAPAEGNWRLLDGKHRWTASEELGKTEIPAVFLDDLSEQEEHDLAIMLNVARRHLTADKKRDIVRSELKRDWNRSDRWIGRVSGVDGKTVAAIRERMREEDVTLEAPVTQKEVEEFEHFQHPEEVQKDLLRNLRTTKNEEMPVEPKTEVRKDPRGHEHVVSTEPKPSSVAVLEAPEKPPAGEKIKLGYAVIPANVLAGEMVDVWFDGVYYTLVPSRD